MKLIIAIMITLALTGCTSVPVTLPLTVVEKTVTDKGCLLKIHSKGHMEIYTFDPKPEDCSYNVGDVLK